WLRGLSHELAVRRAVGATKGSIAKWVLVRAAGAGIGGTALGCFLYLSVMQQPLDEILAGVPAWDTGIVAVSSLLLVAAAVAGAVVPLRRLLGRPVAEGIDG
ncbi:MAG TPA: hypothetical protein VL100_02165, partial [Croceibacterium sp.]|nr:hypothetical protein [Croceibacterium sp.]